LPKDFRDTTLGEKKVVGCAQRPPPCILGLAPKGHLRKNTGAFHSEKGRKGMSVEEKVKSIIVEQLGVDANEVTPEASFVDDLGADSLDTVELVMAFEEAFNIEIPDEAAEKIQKVKDAIEYVEKNSSKN